MFDGVVVERSAEDDVAAALAFARSRAGRSIPAQDVAVRWALIHPHAARFAAAVPGPGLAGMVQEVAVADAPSEDLLEVVAAWDRLAGWVVAGQARVLQELHRRAVGSTWAVKGLRDEVAGTLAASGRAAQVLLDRAVELGHAPEVHDALALGVVSVRKADVLLRETGSLTGQEARAVHTEVLDRAHELTAPQVGAAARRAVLQVDPDAAEHRHHQAVRDRCVVLEPAPDCMATLRACLPAGDAVRVMHALDPVATTAAPEDPRGVDARRADALVDVLGSVLDGTTDDLGALLTGRGGPGADARDSAGAGAGGGAGTGPGVRTSRRRRRRPVKLAITVTADALAGATWTPAWLDRYGPVLPSLARHLAAEATWHFQRTDPATGEALEQPGSRYRPRTPCVRRSSPATSPAPSPAAAPPPTPATWTTPSPSTTPATRPGRPDGPTSPPCAATTTSSRPTPDGHPTATPRPESRRGPHRPVSRTPATPSRHRARPHRSNRNHHSARADRAADQRPAHLATKRQPSRTAEPDARANGYPDAAEGTPCAPATRRSNRAPPATATRRSERAQ
ncbi:hypothetical protein [Actinotalea sp. Marseille-Q4924]|uniref:DUF222 domain-containing protein n=1 Tax=Actinotalea sp. Marseille-Q4924 TaxID=2866571 RepID=UPI002107D4A8|nr:hypothetical protein [Actinotalea sp. Marseille-Q4924]